MFAKLSAQWRSGMRLFDNELISDGVCDIVKIVLDDMFVRHPEFPAFSHAGLMARLQREFNQGSVRLSFLPLLPPTRCRNI